MNPVPLLAAVLLGAGDDAPITLGLERQLFLDDHLIASMTNVRRRVQTAEKFAGNPVLRKTEPWEDPLDVVYGSVIEDAGKYKCWYMSGPAVCYAESEDGISWIKPRLDLVTVGGERTNILFARPGAAGASGEFPFYQELFGVHRDDREPDPSRRFKMGILSLDRKYAGPRESAFHKGQRRALGVAASPDGIHWKLIDGFASDAISDGGTHWMLDPARERYVLYGRTLSTPPEVEAAWSGFDWYPRWHSGRAVARIESSDFVRWSRTEPASAPVVMTADLLDPPGTEIYSLSVFPYQGAYVGLVQSFLARPDACALEVQLAVSRDGVSFTRVGDRSPFIPVGPVGSWDRFNQSMANNPPIVVGDELRFYYGGRTYRHSPYDGKDTGPVAATIGFASIRRDRFVSLEASFDGGEVLTKPLHLGGKTLHVNARSDFGSIGMEALDSGGQVIARARPFRMDSLDAAVEWDGDPPAARGSAIVLRITLRNARLFAIWCT